VHLTQGTNLADLFGIIAGSGFVGSLVGYVIGAVRSAMGKRPYYSALMRHFGGVPAVGVAMFVLFDQLAIHWK
jgi:hypothetical protein